MNFTTEGKFADALKQFRNCLQMIPIFVANSAAQEKEAKNLAKSCAEYITAMRCQIERQKLPATSKQRNTELWCYMAIAKMEHTHRFLALKNAMGAAYKIGNHITAAHLCKRILDFKEGGVLIYKITVKIQYRLLQKKLLLNSKKIIILFKLKVQMR